MREPDHGNGVGRTGPVLPRRLRRDTRDEVGILLLLRLEAHAFNRDGGTSATTTTPTAGVRVASTLTSRANNAAAESELPQSSGFVDARRVGGLYHATKQRRTPGRCPTPRATPRRCQRMRAVRFALRCVPGAVADTHREHRRLLRAPGLAVRRPPADHSAARRASSSAAATTPAASITR